jgi:hypothetical protein
VIGKATDTAFLCGIDELDEQRYLCTMRSIVTYLIFLKHHEVEMFEPFISVMFHSSMKGLLVYHFSNVLVNEIVSINPLFKTA